MKNILLIILISTLVGCASAKPNFYNGRYYMTGDSDCVKGRAISESRIMCANSKGQETGYRDAMTDQQLQMYQHNQQMSQQKNTNCYKTYSGGINCTTY